MELFDACAYVGDWATERLAYTTSQALLGEMDRLGIGRALVCHTLAWQNAPSVGNARLMAEIAGQPRLEPCWVVKPGEPGDGAGSEAPLGENLAEHGVRAVRLCPRDHVYPMAEWMLGRLLATLAERRYLVLIDLDQIVLPAGLYDVDPAGWTHVAWLCEAYPELAIVLTRVGYRALHVLLPLMRKCANLHLDLSYFATHQGVEEVVAQLGPERLLFGTSQPLVDPGGALMRWAYAEVPPGQHEMIARHNLDRLLDRVGGPRPRLGWEQSPLAHAAPAASGTVPVVPPSPAAASAAQAAPQPIDLAALAKAGRSLAESGMDIVDAHVHLGPYRNFYIPDPTADGMVKVMDRCGIARACLASHMALGPDWIAGNRQTAEAVAAFPDRFVGLAVPNPHQPEAIRAEMAFAFDTLGFRAIKLHPDLAAYPVDGDGYRPAWEFASERGCPVLSHTFHGSRFCDPQVFGTLADRYPTIPIVLVHSGSQTAAFAGAIALAGAHPNLYLDVSGSYITGWWIARMVREAGAGRVIFSSDVPFIDLRYSLGRVVFAGLTLAEQTLVLGGNIRRLLGFQLAQA